MNIEPMWNLEQQIHRTRTYAEKRIYFNGNIKIGRYEK